MIVVCIIMTIAAISVPNLMAAIDAARVARAVADVRVISEDITIYYAANGVFPDSLAQIGDDVHIDPWGNPYQYLNHANMQGNGQVRKDRFLVPLNSDYDLYSMGKDGQSKPPLTAKPSQDDVVRATDGSYVGLASAF